MSSRAMGGITEYCCLCCLQAGSFIYGCGPGQIVGLFAVPYYGGCTVVNKIRMTWQKAHPQVSEAGNGQDLLKQRKMQQHRNHVLLKSFGLGMVPVVGGVLALHYYIAHRYLEG